MGGNESENSKRRKIDDPSRNLNKRFDNSVELVEERLLVRESHKSGSKENAKNNDGGDCIVGKGVDRIDRDEQFE